MAARLQNIVSYRSAVADAPDRCADACLWHCKLSGTNLCLGSRLLTKYPRHPPPDPQHVPAGRGREHSGSVPLACRMTSWNTKSALPVPQHQKAAELTHRRRVADGDVLLDRPETFERPKPAYQARCCSLLCCV